MSHHQGTAPIDPSVSNSCSQLPPRPRHPQEGVSWDRTPTVPWPGGMLPPQVPHLFRLDGDMAVGGGHHNVRGLKLADVGHHLVGVTLGTHPGAQAAGVHGTWGLCGYWRAAGHGATVPKVWGTAGHGRVLGTLQEGGLGVAGDSGSLGILKVLGDCRGNWGSQGSQGYWRGTGWSGGT